MRKCVLITKDSHLAVAKRYAGHRFFALPEAKEIADQLEDAVSFLPEEESQKKEEGLYHSFRYLFERGYDEIIVLTTITSSAVHFLQGIRMFETYGNISIAFENEKESLRYFPVGTYILTKDECQNFSVFGFLKAVISIDYATSKVSHYPLDEEHSPILSLEFISRLVVLHVEKGSVLFVKNWEVT